MKKSIADKWVKALRSGKYKQGRDKLYNKENKTHCCLGVLCAISPYKNRYTRMKDDLEYENTGLPPEVMRWAGIIKQPIDLMSLNDGIWNVDPISFDKIASHIQRNYKKL